MSLPDPNKPFVAVPTGRSADAVIDEFLDAMDAYFDAHPDEKPPNWDDEDEEDDCDAG